MRRLLLAFLLVTAAGCASSGPYEQSGLRESLYMSAGLNAGAHVVALKHNPDLNPLIESGGDEAAILWIAASTYLFDWMARAWDKPWIAKLGMSINLASAGYHLSEYEPYRAPCEPVNFLGEVQRCP